MSITPEQWEQLREMFRVAIEHEPQQRAAYLDQACDHNPALRAEIESLLASHDHANDFIEMPAFANTLKVITELPVEQLAGQRIGQYKIIREIGRGGMGTVYLAERADEQYQKLVAIKVVRRGMDTEDILRRFRNERQILANLDHPNIARLLDGGTTDDGLPFLVMDYVEGMPVTDYCDHHRLTTNKRLKLFRMICAAVQHAHQHQVVHRDLKPSNILITTDGTPKLLDFGIAKVLNPELSALTVEQTLTELRVLTPDYASPEQVRGEKIKATSDVYSLGVLLYELLTGHRPYRSTSTPTHELARVICELEPAKPSTAITSVEVITHGETKPQTTITPESVSRARDTQPDKLRRRLSGDLDNIVLMALRKEPARRYQSAAQLSSEIERHLTGLPVIARQDSLGYRIGKLVLRRKARIAAAAVVVLALLLGIVATYSYFSLNRRSTDSSIANPLGNVKTIAVLPLKSLSNPPRDQELRVGLAESIVTKLSAVKRLVVRPTSSTINYLDQNYDTLAVGRELQVDSVLEGSVQREANELEINLQMVSVADGKVLWAESFTNDLSNILSGQESVANRVSRLLTLNRDSDSVQNTAQSSSNLSAQEAFLKGRYAMATSARKMENVFQARDAFEETIRLDPKFALAYSGLANTYTTAASLNLLSPQDSYPKAETAARRALELDPNLAPAYIALADVESDYNWNWQAAEADHKRALELAPNYSPVHGAYAEFLARMGRFDEATAQSDLAHQLDPTKINAEAVRALHYFYERRFDDTVTQSKIVLAKDPSAYLAYLYIALAQAAKGNYSEGIEAGKKARAITGGAPPDLFVLGYNYALAKDDAKASKVLTELQSLSKKQYVDLFYFAVIYSYRGDKTKAFDYLDKAYAEKSYWMTTLKINPLADALRSDDRFAQMLQKLRLNN